VDSACAANAIANETLRNHDRRRPASETAETRKPPVSYAKETSSTSGDASRSPHDSEVAVCAWLEPRQIPQPCSHPSSGCRWAAMATVIGGHGEPGRRALADLVARVSQAAVVAGPCMDGQRGGAGAPETRAWGSVTSIVLRLHGQEPVTADCACRCGHRQAQLPQYSRCWGGPRPSSAPTATA
jgi:hypothetical protein